MSKITRRKFVNAAVIGTGAILGARGVALGQFHPSAPSTIVASDALSVMTWDSFLPFVNTDFTFGSGKSAVTLRLTDIKDSRPLKATAISLGQENFVLKFQGAVRNSINSGMYRVNHFSLGDFDLCITNHGQAGRVVYYSAVINRVLVN